MGLRNNHEGKYRPDIDGLRALAVLSGITFHYFPDFFPGGFHGVDIFFIISGYLITGILLKSLEANTFTFRAFYNRRIRRLFPTLILVLVFAAIAGWIGMTSDELKEMGKHLATGAGFVANFNYASEIDYFDQGIEYKPLLALWSLSLEEQYYIIWPVVLLFASKLKLDFRKVTFVLLVIMFFVSWYVYGKHPSESYYLPQCRFWELLAGSFLATMMRDRHLGKGRAADLFSLLGFILLIGGMLAALSATPVNLIVPVVGSILLILSGPEAFLNRHILSSSVMVSIGLISYCLYLWHWPLLSLTKVIFMIEPGTPLRLGLYGLTFILSWFSYKFIEKPCRKSPRKSIPIILAGLVLFLGLFGLMLYKTNLISPLERSPSEKGKLGLFDAKVRRDPQIYQKLNQSRIEVTRDDICHLNTNIPFEDHINTLKKCITGDFSKPTFVIVGDSHAADIYGALTRSHGQYHFIQMTVAGCKHRKSFENCRKLYDYAVSFSLEHPVRGVIFSGNWDSQYASILESAYQLKQSRRNVLMIGPRAQFREKVFHFISKRSSDDDLKSLVTKFIRTEQFQLNQEMRDFAQKNQIQFLDILGLFCSTRDSCELISDDGELLVIDRAHLSLEGMDFVGKKLLKDKTFNNFTQPPVPGSIE